MEKINIDGTEIQAEKGSLLSRILQEVHPEFPQPCAGQGRCGKCKVKAAGALSEPDEGEKKKLTAQELADGIRLACRTRVEGSCEIWLPEQKETVVLQEGTLHGRYGSTTEAETPLFDRVGAAIDIGTTTMAASLYDRSGLTAQAGIANPQLNFGADVISRIEKSLAGGALELAESVQNGIQSLLHQLCSQCGCGVSEVDTIVITGNTAMLYLLTGRNPETLSRAPFEADWLGDAHLKGRDLNLDCADADVFLPPCIGAFVGADTVTAILASGLCDSEDTRLLADIGTNGEIALWKDGMLYCCSTAAGPAFEGTGLSMGMPGKEGAVAHVKTENGALYAKVIGDAEPKGICGSGVIDAVSCLLELGWLDETGYLEEEEAVIAGAVTLNQEDIRKVQLAKSAICAGIKTALHRAGMEVGDLQELLVAGGFGSFLTLHNAIRVGLLPEMEESRITVCGNAALAGAVGILRNRQALERARKIVSRAQLVDLAADAFFQDAYINEMFFEEI